MINHKFISFSAVQIYDLSYIHLHTQSTVNYCFFSLSIDTSLPTKQIKNRWNNWYVMDTQGIRLGHRVTTVGIHWVLDALSCSFNTKEASDLYIFSNLHVHAMNKCYTFTLMTRILQHGCGWHFLLWLASYTCKSTCKSVTSEYVY